MRRAREEAEAMRSREVEKEQELDRLKRNCRKDLTRKNITRAVLVNRRCKQSMPA